MGIPDHLTCLLRNLSASQEATVRTGLGTTASFQIGKGVRQGYILSPCLFNLHAEYITRNAGLDKAQAGIKIAGRNINNLRYANDTPDGKSWLIAKDTDAWRSEEAWGEGDDRGRDGWMASSTQWTWVWVNCRSWWWTGRPGMLQPMRLQRVRQDWATEQKITLKCA